MKIIKASFVKGVSAFYFDDQAAVKAGAEQNGFTYQGDPVTSGFTSVRQAGESISVLLYLENGQIARGDCIAVQYSGAGGRNPIFIADHYLELLEQKIAPKLVGRSVINFKANSRYFDALLIDGYRLHTAIRYGLSQALLDATALAKGRLKSEIICAEYALPINTDKLRLFGQSGDDRYIAADKMILKGVDTLPHALINSIDKIGQHGETLCDYIQWLAQRITSLRPNADYHPNLHLDVYGMMGVIFDQDADKIADYIARLQEHAGDFQLYIEGPVDAGDKYQQIDILKRIKDRLKAIDSPAKIVADEWCNTYRDVVDFVDARCCHMVQIKTPDLGGVHNTVDAVLYARKHKVEAYQGGTCNETDISAQVCTHLALAARPDLMLIKPGMGFDEGMTIVANEMSRAIHILEYRQAMTRQRIVKAG